MTSAWISRASISGRQRDLNMIAHNLHNVTDRARSLIHDHACPNRPLQRPVLVRSSRVGHNARRKHVLPACSTGSARMMLLPKRAFRLAINKLAKSWLNHAHQPAINDCAKFEPVSDSLPKIGTTSPDDQHGRAGVTRAKAIGSRELGREIRRGKGATDVR